MLCDNRWVKIADASMPQDGSLWYAAFLMVWRYAVPGWVRAPAAIASRRV
jgi:hypothetical protein